jgi:pyoverdine/dityrosine biosynthesis protein Dit1
MEELEDRWSRLIDRKAREDLINDVKFLARDNLRRVVKVQKNFKPTQEIISDIAANLVSRNKALRSLSARDSLLLYLELYMLKLLGNIK